MRAVHGGTSKGAQNAEFSLDNNTFSWIYKNKMNLIKQLLSRRHHAESTPSTSVLWPGESGTEYPYEIYPLETQFPPVPGNYIYSGQNDAGQWVPIYVAQTRDMHQRLEGHEKLQEAMEHGATHIHAHLDSGTQAARCTEERDIIRHWQPVCNSVMES